MDGPRKTNSISRFGEVGRMDGDDGVRMIIVSTGSEYNGSSESG